MAQIDKHARRVIVWAGEETHLTSKIIDLLSEFATIYKSVESQINDGHLTNFNFPAHIQDRLRATHLNDGTTLGQFLESSFWGSLEVFSSRAPSSADFGPSKRLPIARSQKTTILFGSQSLESLLFCSAIRLLYGCDYFMVNLRSNTFDMVWNIYNHSRIPSSGQSLLSLLFYTSGQLVSDQRDRIFALLGLADDATLSHFAGIDYSCSIGQVFFAACKCIALESRTLIYLAWNKMYAQAQVRTGASWIPSFNCSQSVPATKVNMEKFMGGLNVEFQDSALCRQGFVFDIISSAYRNFSLENLKSMILEDYRNCENPTCWYHRG